MIWFTSDWHFNHTNIAGPKFSKWTKGYRNFENTFEMNNIIIDNLNRLVMPNDAIYFLGDFAFGDKKKIPELRERINCKNIWLCYGNHDHAIQQNKEYQKLFTKCGYYFEFNIEKTPFVAFHYAMKVWNKSHHGAIHLYGHSHASLPDDPNSKSFDCGIDTSYPQYGVMKKFEPYSLDEVLKIASQKNVSLVDHHNSETN